MSRRCFIYTKLKTKTNSPLGTLSCFKVLTRGQMLGVEKALGGFYLLHQSGCFRRNSVPRDGTLSSLPLPQLMRSKSTSAKGSALPVNPFCSGLRTCLLLTAAPRSPSPGPSGDTLSKGLREA